MTAALLKQAREALTAAMPHHQGFHSKVGMAIAEALSALDAHAALSDYDKAVHALKDYLPEGWVAQDESGWIYLHRSEPHLVNGGDIWVSSASYDERTLNDIYRIPKHEDWRASLRRIVHNQDGTTVVERV